MTQASANRDGKWTRIGRIIAVALTLAIVVAVSWQFRPTPKVDDMDIPDQPLGSKMPVGMDQVGDDAWTVQAGPALMIVSGRPASNFMFRMRAWGMVDDESRMLIGALRTLQRDPAAVENAGVSNEQLKTINDIQPPRMVISEDDRQRMEKLWHAFEAADDSKKRDAQQEMFDAMRDITERSVEPTKKAWSDAGKQLQQTLTLEQLAKVAVYMQNNGIPQGGPGGFRGDGGGGGGGIR